MARRAEHYSRTVAWLKIALPIAALALLSTLFLFARDTGQAMDLPFADFLPSPEEGLKEQVGAPYYAGATENGDLLTMTASRASPAGEGRIRATDLTATISALGGMTYKMRSDDAVLENSDNQAFLSGGVVFESSDGYVFTTEELRAALNRIEGESFGPVAGRGPAGTLEAGKMQFESNDETGGVQLLFTGGVKLVYTPQS